MSESTDLKVVGAMIDIIEQTSHRHGTTRNEVVERLETILIEGTSIRIDKRREIVGWVKERYWQEAPKQGPQGKKPSDDS